jgi:hypothetical protein
MGASSRSIYLEAVIVSKPQKPAPKNPHEWGMTLEDAVDRIEAAVGSPRNAEQEINESLRTGRLKSGEWQISPDGEGTWRPLNSSDWAQRRVWVLIPLVFKAGRIVLIGGPKFAGQVLICRADLDRYYPPAARRAAIQSDDKRRTSRRRRTLLQEMLEASLRRCYPDGVPPDTTTAAVRRMVEPVWKAECQARKLKLQLPSWDTIARKRQKMRVAD